MFGQDEKIEKQHFRFNNLKNNCPFCTRILKIVDLLNFRHVHFRHVDLVVDLEC